MLYLSGCSQNEKFFPLSQLLSYVPSCPWRQSRSSSNASYTDGCHTRYPHSSVSIKIICKGGWIDDPWYGLVGSKEICTDAFLLFCQIVDSVVCINPGYLSKKQSGGTFARATIHPLQLSSDGSVGVEGKIWERARVDLIKI